MYLYLLVDFHIVSVWLVSQLKALLPILHQGASKIFLIFTIPYPTTISWNSKNTCSSS